MLNNRALRATLTSYYEAIGSHEFDAIPKYYTPSMTIVTLSGSKPLRGPKRFRIFSGNYGHYGPRAVPAQKWVTPPTSS